MSFVRPEARAALARVAEPVATGAGAAWLAWAGAERLAGAPLVAVLLFAGAAALLAWCIAAAARAAVSARAARAVPGPGLVEITERRIVLWGPRKGGAVALDALETVAAWPDGDGGVGTWELVPEEGPPLVVPAGARGAEALPDALSALPGFDALAALRRLDRGGPERVVLWRRRGTGPRRIG